MEWTDKIRSVDAIEAFLVANLRPPTWDEVEESGLDRDDAKIVLCYKGKDKMHYVVNAVAASSVGHYRHQSFLFYIGPMNSGLAGQYAFAYNLSTLINIVAQQYMSDFVK